MHFDQPVAAPVDAKAGPWYKELTRYHWFVFAVAAAGWLADCMDQQLFNLARDPAIAELRGTRVDSVYYGGMATMIFMFGWATGGMVFGVMGDRIGRVKTMMLTILLYSMFTGLSALAQGFWDFAFYRFLTGLGVGGEFAVGVALVAEAMPDRARSYALGWLQASSTVGNVSAAFIAMGLGELQHRGMLGQWSPWRWEFVIGAAPAVLILLIQRRLKEPEKWHSMRANLKPGQKVGSMVELLTVPRLRHNALVGLVLATSGVVGLWAIGFFGFGLVGRVLRGPFEEEARTPQSVADDRMLVGLILANPSDLAQVEEAKLLPNWLLDPTSRLVYKVILELSKEGSTITHAAVAEAATKDGKTLSADEIRSQFVDPASTQPMPLTDLISTIEQRNREVDGLLTWWTGIYGLMFNVGGFFGVYSFSRFTHRMGRKPAFAVTFVLALLTTALTFSYFYRVAGLLDIFWMVPLMGFSQLALFGGYAIYFPELFPTRLRSTGTSFCYNVGRYLAAPGPLLLGTLASMVYGNLGEVLSYRYAGVTMCAFFLLGLAALPFAPETKGQPLPE